MKFQTIIPKLKFDPLTVNSQFEVQMIRFMRVVHSDFMMTVSTWKHKIKFTNKTHRKRKVIEGEVLTGYKRYAYVNNGTKGHYVYPKNASALRFRSSYTAKTRAGDLISRGGGASGARVFSKGHWVKGIEARNFDKEIKALREKDFLSYMEKPLFEITKQ